MSASFKRINYSLRPAKHAERKMLCDVFRRLIPFGRIEEYVYVGFGSVWFSDFVLFHRSLGVRNMISIEQAVNARERIEDNKPFRIPVDYRKSEYALPDLDWSRNQIIWLDYDVPLSTDILLDMRTVARRAGTGTVLTVTVQCSKAPQSEEAEREPPSSLNRFINTFGQERVHHKTKEDQLYGWPFGELSRTMLQQEIDAELAIRNFDNMTHEMHFHPICDIEYQDGAKMTTIIGVFCSADNIDKLTECHFEALEFMPNDRSPIRIEVPTLTAREFKKLESQLPLFEGDELQLGTIPKREADQFVKLYRYLPNFAVLES